MTRAPSSLDAAMTTRRLSSNRRNFSENFSMFCQVRLPCVCSLLLFVRNLHFPISWPIRRMKHPETSGRSRHRPSPTASGPGARDCRRAMRAIHWNMARNTRAIRGASQARCNLSTVESQVQYICPSFACCLPLLLFPSFCFGSRRDPGDLSSQGQTKSNTRITERMNERKTPQTQQWHTFASHHDHAGTNPFAAQYFRNNRCFPDDDTRRKSPLPVVVVEMSSTLDSLSPTSINH